MQRDTPPRFTYIRPTPPLLCASALPNTQSLSSSRSTKTERQHKHPIIHFLYNTHLVASRLCLLGTSSSAVPLIASMSISHSILVFCTSNLEYTLHLLTSMDTYTTFPLLSHLHLFLFLCLISYSTLTTHLPSIISISLVPPSIPSTIVILLSTSSLSYLLSSLCVLSTFISFALLCYLSCLYS